MRRPGASTSSEDVQLTKHSRSERERRKQQREDVARIQAAWEASVPPAVAKEFARAVAEARARPPEVRPDMAPGTAPNPPRPGREPKPPKAPQRSRRSY